MPLLEEFFQEQTFQQYRDLLAEDSFKKVNSLIWKPLKV